MRFKVNGDERQEAIKKLIEIHTISDQKQLVELLKKEYQIITNQAVVSRDLRKLAIVKKIINGVLTYEVPIIDVSVEILKLALIDINYNETMIVIKTFPGLAAFVGDCIDQYDEDLGILGCLGGENVVFVIPSSITSIKESYRKICQKFNFKKRV